MLSTDPVGFLLDADGDLDISAGRLQFAAGLVAFIQGANARILLIKGEWFLDREAGVPVVENDFVRPSEALVGQRFDEQKARRAFTSAISGTPGFGSLTSMAIVLDKVTRELAVTWSAQTAFGDTGAITSSAGA